MGCVVCGSPAGYNRAVVDTVFDDEIGGLCLQCEQRVFDPSLVPDREASPGACWVCRRDGFYAFPQWKPYSQQDGSEVLCNVDFKIDQETLRLCDEHFLWIKQHGLRGNTTLRPRED